MGMGSLGRIGEMSVLSSSGHRLVLFFVLLTCVACSTPEVLIAELGPEDKSHRLPNANGLVMGFPAGRVEVDPNAHAGEQVKARLERLMQGPANPAEFPKASVKPTSLKRSFTPDEIAAGQAVDYSESSPHNIDKALGMTDKQIKAATKEDVDDDKEMREIMKFARKYAPKKQFSDPPKKKVVSPEYDAAKVEVLDGIDSTLEDEDQNLGQSFKHKWPDINPWPSLNKLLERHKNGFLHKLIAKKLAGRLQPQLDEVMGSVKKLAAEFSKPQSNLTNFTYPRALPKKMRSVDEIIEQYKKHPTAQKWNDQIADATEDLSKHEGYVQDLADRLKFQAQEEEDRKRALAMKTLQRTQDAAADERRQKANLTKAERNVKVSDDAKARAIVDRLTQVDLDLDFPPLPLPPPSL